MGSTPSPKEQIAPVPISVIQPVTLQLPASAIPAVLPPSRSPFVQQVRDYASRGTVASFIGGGVAGAVSRTLVSPLERMKILFQVQGPTSSSYQGVVPALTKMWKEEGWRGFMRGNGTNCIRIAPYSAVQFSSYNIYKKWLMEPGHTELDTKRRLAGGAMAGVTSVVATYPLDITRTRLSVITASLESLGRDVAMKEAPGMWSVMKQMYKSEGGVPALYRGLVPTLAGVAPYVGLNFAVYETIREWMTPEGQAGPSGWSKLMGGAMSGAIAQTITYPFDLLRRRFQVNTMTGLGYQYKSIWDAIVTIMRQEGIRGMYKGILPNLLKVAPSMASSWYSFELVRDLCMSLKDVEAEAF